MSIPKRKSLAGTCGIPKEQDRIYVKTFDRDGFEKAYPPGVIPKRCLRLLWEFGKFRRLLPAGSSGGNYLGTCASMFA